MARNTQPQYLQKDNILHLMNLQGERAKPERKNHLFIFTEMSKRGQNKKKQELKICVVRGTSHGVRIIQGYFRQNESPWSLLWSMLCIYFKRLKEVQDCFN